jgi:hypothetical protein
VCHALWFILRCITLSITTLSVQAFTITSIMAFSIATFNIKEARTMPLRMMSFIEIVKTKFMTVRQNLDIII